jgi:hypothetical protein
VDVEFYAIPGPFTALTAEQVALVERLGREPLAMCLAAQRLLISPLDAMVIGVSEPRRSERNIRPATLLLDRALELDGRTPFDRERPPEHRVVGTCRHFAVLATAFLRAVDIPARARCGFAAYFVTPQKVDHWTVEVWSADDQRWVRIDPEYVGRDTPLEARPDDLRPGEFLTAGEGWLQIRSDRASGDDFGVFGTENWGLGEVRGNAMRDLASVVRKVEMLPWDEWGPMQDSYEGRTDAAFDELMDELAEAMRDEDTPTLEQIYQQLAVPESLVC